MIDTLTDEVRIVILSAIPFTELRLTIPMAIALGFPGYKAFFLAVLGNFLPIVPLVYLLPIIENRLLKYRLINNLFDFFHKRSIKKGKKIEKYGPWGLLLFVAIPFPGTGIYTGAFIAFLFQFEKKISIAIITVGMLVAGIIMTLLSSGLKEFYFLFSQVEFVLVLSSLLGLSIILYKRGFRK